MAYKSFFNTVVPLQKDVHRTIFFLGVCSPIRLFYGSLFLVAELSNILGYISVVVSSIAALGVIYLARRDDEDLPWWWKGRGNYLYRIIFPWVILILSIISAVRINDDVTSNINYFIGCFIIIDLFKGIIQYMQHYYF